MRYGQIRQGFINGYQIESVILCCAMICSTIYHLFENIKHLLPGIQIFMNFNINSNIDKIINLITLNLDRLTAILAMVVSLRTDLMIRNENNIINYVMIGLLSLFCSEILPKFIQLPCRINLVLLKLHLTLIF